MLGSHIVTVVFLRNSCPNHGQLNYSASVLAVLQLFNFDIGSFNGEKVNSLVNVMTLEKNIHEAFNRMLFYFEATVSVNFYSLNHDVHLVLCHRRRRIIMKLSLALHSCSTPKCVNSSHSRPRIPNVFPYPHVNSLPCTLLSARLLTSLVRLSI